MKLIELGSWKVRGLIKAICIIFLLFFESRFWDN
jgi:hypothetical protein